MMDRKEAIEILEKYKEECEEDYYVKRAEALEIALKALKDKKARYWKRRWLKQRDAIYFVIHTFDTLGLHSSAEFIKIVLLGGKYEE